MVIGETLGGLYHMDEIYKPGHFSPTMLPLNVEPILSAGVKHDQGKPKIGMVLQYFPLAALEVAKCGTYGTSKYGNGAYWDHNWGKVEYGIERYSDAMLRHFLLEPIEVTDKDTELLHAAHVAWNAMARLELMLQEKKRRETDGK